MLTAVAKIVFGAALLMPCGTMPTESPTRCRRPSRRGCGAGGLSVLFLVGAVGIDPGVLALLSIDPQTLAAVTIIAIRGTLLMSSNSVWH